mmetsp:Transcript_16031/g.24993  ORF Transcript_16031/g.24993 Transcript_16031/m.24993 type:complete len:152 (+) Transcript_16031:231-686(+)
MLRQVVLHALKVERQVVLLAESASRLQQNVENLHNQFLDLLCVVNWTRRFTRHCCLWTNPGGATGAWNCMMFNVRKIVETFLVMRSLHVTILSEPKRMEFSFVPMWLMALAVLQFVRSVILLLLVIVLHVEGGVGLDRVVYSWLMWSQDVD